jgi:deoxyribose-phosphate aldolase
MTTMPDRELARFIQHTLIQPGTTAADITRHCEQAVRYGFDAAMVPAVWVPLARRILAGSTVKLASAIDFPLGCMTTAGKVAEAQALVAAGAQQLDIGVHTGLLRSGLYDEYRQDIAAVVACVDVPIKVMLELPLLNAAERERAVDLAVAAGAAWLKNASSGAIGVATPEDIAFLRERAPANVGVKASGGVSSRGQVRSLIDAGADLVGTSAGLSILGVETDRATSY